MPTFHTTIVLKHRRSKRKASKATGAENSDLPMAQTRGGSASFGISPEPTQVKTENIIASRKTSIIQGIHGCTPIPTCPPGEIPIFRPYIVGVYGFPKNP